MDTTMGYPIKPGWNDTSSRSSFSDFFLRNLKAWTSSKSLVKDEPVCPSDESVCPQNLDFTDISSDGITLHLKEKLTIPVNNEDGWFSLDFPEANIFIADESTDELREHFCEDFVFVWNEYAMEDDENLTPDGIAIKRWMLSAVKE